MAISAPHQTNSGNSSSDVLLSARAISVRFGGLTALRDVSLDVPKDAVVGLIGPNGAGKSTLFGVVTGFQRPLSGTVRLAGVDVTKLAPHRRARLGMGRSFQHPELFAALTVSEHFLLAIRMGRGRGRVAPDLCGLQGWKGPTAAEQAKVSELLALLELEHLADEACNTLPTGASRLVQVGRVLAMDPKLVMLDEPAAGLDDRETKDLDRALRQVRREVGVSLLIVEHDLEFVFGLCESITVLDAGSVIASGTPAEIRRNEAVQAAYLGDVE